MQELKKPLDRESALLPHRRFVGLWFDPVNDTP
jgi:hypothetical protein